MWNGKNRAVTFSFDDGVTQDVRLIEIFNKYGLKCTFNLNSALLGLKGQLETYGKTVSHNKVLAEEVAKIYAGHEIAVHTLTHPLLPSLDDSTVIRQVEEDRKALESFCGYPVVGMAYPCGGDNHDKRVADVIAKNTKICYARTIISSHDFALQDDLYRFRPTVHFMEDCFENIVEKFLNDSSKENRLLYIWGHSYELDAGKLLSWEKFEEICKLLAGRKEIFYGTNREVLL